MTPASGNATSYSGVANAEEVEYTYDDALRLSKINTATTEYTFTYDSFGNSTSVSAGSNTLATYEYNSNNGKLNKINYGNGFSEEYVYGNLEKVESVWYNYSNGTRTLAYSYAYNEDGSLEKFTNHLNGEVVTYEYDYAGRFVSSSETKASNSGYKNDYSVDYDGEGRVIEAKSIIDYLVSSTVYNNTVRMTYEYNANGTLQDERAYFAANDVIVSEYTYGEFNRLTGISRTAGSFDQDISYIYYSQSNKTENLISGYTSTVNGNETSFSYAYDSKGNITQIDASNDSTVVYTYDDLSQLISEAKGNTTKNYTYDSAGNITAITTTIERQILDPDPGFTPIIKAVDTLPSIITTTKNLSYTNSQWGDLLTSFDGTAITYDGIGNPLSYYNGTSYTFTWEGRRLVGAVKGTKTMSFAYNDEGIRTSKTVDGVTTTYYVNGGQIVAEKTDTRTIVYIYDATGAPIGMMYRTTSYAKDVWDTFWYEKNLQGDIIAVYNSAGTKLISYNYSDAWGNYTVSYSNGGGTTGATYNPFKYRGYYYDTDLSMYYLQSRYYDAKICRFISADYASVTTATPYALTDKNLYAYCDNNPVTRVDGDGMFWATVFDIASLAFSIAEVAYDPSNVWAWIGLAGDVIDLLPVITGVGETIDFIRLGRFGGNVLDAVDDAYDAARVIDKGKGAVKASERAGAVRKAWKIEFENVSSGGKGVSRVWSKLEIDELLSTGKVKGYQGHHMKSVKGYPNLAGDPNNIQFLTRSEHLRAHGGNFRNITHGRYTGG